MELPQNSAPASERKTILMLGMHRSGTSLLSRLINLMGAHIGRHSELIPPDPKINPAGYWEREDLVCAHEDFLQKNGFAWAKLAGFSLDTVDPASVETLCVSLAEICSRIDSGGHSLLVKDPRLCLLLPVWHRVVQGPVHLFAVRDPRQIAASLLTAFPGVFTTYYLLALWQKHVQMALSALRGKRVLFVSYADLLHSPERGCERLMHGLAELGVRDLRPLQGAELDSVLDRKLNRSGSARHARLSPAQADLQHWLGEQCGTEGPVHVRDTPDFESPDDTLSELEQVREESARQGYRMATQQRKSA